MQVSCCRIQIHVHEVKVACFLTWLSRVIGPRGPVCLTPLLLEQFPTTVFITQRPLRSQYNEIILLCKTPRLKAAKKLRTGLAVFHFKRDWSLEVVLSGRLPSVLRSADVRSVCHEYRCAAYDWCAIVKQSQTNLHQSQTNLHRLHSNDNCLTFPRSVSVSVSKYPDNFAPLGGRLTRPAIASTIPTRLSFAMRKSIGIRALSGVLVPCYRCGGT